MITDRTVRQKLKNWLLISVAVLGFILVALWLYGVIFIKDKKVERAAKLGQYYEFNSENLPSGINTAPNIGNSAPNSEGVNNAPANLQDDTPKITILLTNLGLNKNSTELALSLPKEISLGFLPYTTSLKPLIEQAQELGHEIFLYLPFETQRYPMDSPGHMPLLLSNSDAENVNRLDTLLKPFHGYAGVYGSYKEVFTSNSDKSFPIIDELKRRNLKLFIGRVNKDTIPRGEQYMNFVSADIVLDREPNIASIKDNLDKLVKLAETNKYAVAYAEGYPVTIYTLKAWLPILEKRGIRLVPASHMMENNNAQQQTERPK
jgi:polysaccharide deacetylase 2 family uncharacterized protein YibQ